MGTRDWQVNEHSVMERADLLREIRCGERHPPTPIGLRRQLVYHAVIPCRMIAVVEVISAEAHHGATVEWGR